MPKPTTLKELLDAGHITLGDVRTVARDILSTYSSENPTKAESLNGYIITPPSFDDLPDHVQGFFVKAVLGSTIENIFDQTAANDEEEDDDDSADDESDEELEDDADD